MKTKQEAILNKLANEPNGAGYYYLTDEERSTIVECIDKRTPRKPNKVRCLNGKFAYLCPTCGGGLMSMCRCHYAECGQAIDWSDDE